MPHLNQEGRTSCEHVFKSGARKGQTCDRLLMKYNDEHKCGEHISTYVKKKTLWTHQARIQKRSAMVN